MPKWSYQGGFNQRLNLDGNHALEIGADAFYSSKIYFLPQNSELSKRDAMTIYNALMVLGALVLVAIVGKGLWSGTRVKAIEQPDNASTGGDGSLHGGD